MKPLFYVNFPEDVKYGAHVQGEEWVYIIGQTSSSFPNSCTIYRVSLLTGNREVYSGDSGANAPSVNTIGAFTIAGSNFVITDTSNSRQYYVNKSAGASFNTANGGATAYNLQRGQGNAYNSGASTVLSVANSSNTLLKFTGTTASSITVSSIQSRAIIADPDSNYWIVGGTASNVLVVDASGNVITTITLPDTPNPGTAQSQEVSSLAKTQGQLFVSTINGSIYHYDDTYTLKNTYFPVYSGNSPQGGQALALDEATGVGLSINWDPRDGTKNNIVNLVQASASGLQVMDTFASTAIGGISDFGLDVTLGRAWLVGLSEEFKFACVLDLEYSVDETNIDTAIREGGTYVPGRILRIRDFGKSSMVVRDTQIDDDITPLPERRDGSYFEIALTGSGPTRKFDWRRFYC